MIILFLNPCPVQPGRNHLYRKFHSQIDSAIQLGDEVYYTCYDKSLLYLSHIKEGREEKIVIGKNRFGEKNVLIMHQIMKALRKWIKPKMYDIVYMRAIPPTYTHNETKRALRQSGAKLVIEIPSYPGNEINLSPRKAYFRIAAMFNYLFGNSAYADLYALIGEPASIYQGVPAINIENGLDVGKIPLKHSFAVHPGEIHLLIVAIIQYWHGYDRLIKGIGNYIANNGSRKIILHICGTCHDGSLDKLIKYAENYHFVDNIILHGYQSGRNLDAIFDTCDVAIGSLGLHRAGIKVDTTLKLPEYTARGIPFIYCTTSNNVKTDGNYYLKISDDEKAVDINEVVSFFDSLNKETISIEMREYAESNIQWSTQLIKIKNKIKEMEKNYG